MTELVLYSDFVCPYCYLAEHGPLAQLQQNHDLSLTWRGFELHPYIPKGGATLAQMFSPARAEMMVAQLMQFAQTLGVQMRVPTRVNNTQAALCMAQYALDCGKQAQFREAAMNAYWSEGLNLEDSEVWVILAERAELDAQALSEAATAPEYQARVHALREEAMERGVMGIPTVFINDAPVIGCQPYETYEREARRFGLIG